MKTQEIPTVKAHNAKENMLAARFERNNIAFATKIVNGKSIICNH